MHYLTSVFSLLSSDYFSLQRLYVLKEIALNNYSLQPFPGLQLFWLMSH